MWGSSDASWERGCWHVPVMSSPVAPNLLQELSVAHGAASCDIVSGCKSSTRLAVLVGACRGLVTCFCCAPHAER